MFTQKSIKLFHSVQEIRPFSLFHTLASAKTQPISNVIWQSHGLHLLSINVYASTDSKCHFAIFSLFSAFELRQKLNQSQMSFDNLMECILSISMCMQNFITIFHSVQEIAPLSLFQNLELCKASTDEKCHFAISWVRSCQYQCLRKSLSKYSTHSRDRAIFSF